MARSASRSTSLTKSFGPFDVTVSRSSSRAPRLMMLPARRAAFTAIVSIGCMVGLSRLSRRQRRRGGARRTKAAIVTAGGGARRVRRDPRVLDAASPRSPLCHPDRARRDEPSGQHRRRGARDAHDGPRPARSRRSAPLSRSRRPSRSRRAQRRSSTARGSSRRSTRRSPVACSPIGSVGASARIRGPRARRARGRRPRRSRMPRTAMSRWCSAPRCPGSPTPSSRAAASSRRFPRTPDYASLNLAAAVQVVAYELRARPRRGGDVWRAPRFEPATVRRDRGAATRTARGRSPPCASSIRRMPRRLLPRLRRLFARAALEKEEVSILRGILARIDQLLEASLMIEPPVHCANCGTPAPDALLPRMRAEHARATADVQAVHARSDGPVHRLRRQVLEDARGAPVRPGFLTREYLAGRRRRVTSVPRASSSCRACSFSRRSSSLADAIDIERGWRAVRPSPEGAARPRVEKPRQGREGRAPDARRRLQPQSERACRHEGHPAEADRPLQRACRASRR